MRCDPHRTLIWNLEFSNWNLESGFFDICDAILTHADLESGIWNLEYGLRSKLELKSGIWNVEKHWNLEFLTYNYAV